MPEIRTESRNGRESTWRIHASQARVQQPILPAQPPMVNGGNTEPPRSTRTAADKWSATPTAGATVTNGLSRPDPFYPGVHHGPTPEKPRTPPDQRPSHPVSWSPVLHCLCLMHQQRESQGILRLCAPPGRMAWRMWELQVAPAGKRMIQDNLIRDLTSALPFSLTLSRTSILPSNAGPPLLRPRSPSESASLC